MARTVERWGPVLRREYLILFLIAAVIIFGTGYKYATVRAGSADETLIQSDEQTPDEVCVHVTGAVANPGLYRLPAGARINDAVARAVAAPDADLDALNLAAPLEDGQKILVPAVLPQDPGQPGAPGPNTGYPAANSTLININTADAATLDQLPGIGPALAQRIIQYRQEHGPFTLVDDLVNVPGIGEQRMAELRSLVSVR